MNKTEPRATYKEKTVKYAFDDCTFVEGQPVEIKGRKARVRWMSVVGVGQMAKPKMTGVSSFLKRGKQEIEFVGPRYTYNHPFFTRQFVRDEGGVKKPKLVKKENELGVEEEVIACSIPHAFIRVGDQLGSIEMSAIEPKIVERENWGDDVSLM